MMILCRRAAVDTIVAQSLAVGRSKGKYRALPAALNAGSPPGRPQTLH
jgi:hypothetical protein